MNMNIKDPERDSVYEEVYKLIPLMNRVVKKCNEKDREQFAHTPERITTERADLRPFFEIIQGKWTFDLIHLLNVMGETHYNDIKKILKGISSRVLTDKLKLLEEKRIIERIIHDARPVRISYKLTRSGKKIINLLIPVMKYYVVHDYIVRNYDSSK